MIIKIKKHESSFVIIDSKPLKNPNLSWRAKGLLAYLLTLPDNWVVMAGELATRSKDRRQSTQKAFQELRKAGHATLETIIENGKLQGKEWHIHEQPIKVNEAINSQ